jgi:hypothetical protein
MKPSLVFATTTIALAVSLAAIGCSKSAGGGSSGSSAADPGAPKGGSCMQDKAGLCTEFGDNPAGLAEGACTSLMKGTYAKTACSHDNSIGSCASKGDTTWYYFGNASGPWTEDAADDCKNIHEGTFTATAGAADTAKAKAIPTSDKILASCVQDANACDDEYGDPIKLDISKSFCSAPATWADAKACPSDSLVGTCLSGGTAHRYYAGYLKKNGVSMTDLANLCKSSSIGYAHFYPGPAAPAPGPVVAAGGKGKKGK